MCTSPPIALDRLVGLAGVNKNLVKKMTAGELPPAMKKTQLEHDLERICRIVSELLDHDVFPWLSAAKAPSEAERERAATIIADRLCNSVANPIIRNAQESRQLELIGNWLEARGYILESLPSNLPPIKMRAGTFCFRNGLKVGKEYTINIPIDVIVQPKRPLKTRFPLLIEAKSAGDFTNTNKRRKEEATKIRQIRSSYGAEVRFVLFLCGYFNSGYLGYEAAEGIDWVWEHRIDDLIQFGL